MKKTKKKTSNSKVYKDLAKEGPPEDKKKKPGEDWEKDFYLAEESAKMIGSN